jgi:hypothetical protein
VRSPASAENEVCGAEPSPVAWSSPRPAPCASLAAVFMSVVKRWKRRPPFPGQCPKNVLWLQGATPTGSLAVPSSWQHMKHQILPANMPRRAHSQPNLFVDLPFSSPPHNALPLSGRIPHPAPGQWPNLAHWNSGSARGLRGHLQSSLGTWCRPVFVLRSATHNLVQVGVLESTESL